MRILKKHIIDESNGLHYTLNCDYYLPDLSCHTTRITEIVCRQTSINLTADKFAPEIGVEFICCLAYNGDGRS